MRQSLTEIQQYYVVERTGSEIPEEFFTISGKLAFFEVGFKGGFVSGLTSALLTPFAIGVVERYIPIFGNAEPTPYDKFFAFMLALSFTIGYAAFYAGLGKYYIGGVSKAAVRNLLGGLITGALTKMVVAFILFHFIYFIILEPDRLGRWLSKLTWLVKYDTLNGVYQWLLDFRPVFLTSSYFVVLTTVLMIVIPLVGIHFGAAKTQRIIEQEQQWG